MTTDHTVAKREPGPFGIVVTRESQEAGRIAALRALEDRLEAAETVAQMVAAVHACAEILERMEPRFTAQLRKEAGDGSR